MFCVCVCETTHTHLWYDTRTAMSYLKIKTKTDITQQRITWQLWSIPGSRVKPRLKNRPACLESFCGLPHLMYTNTVAGSTDLHDRLLPRLVVHHTHIAKDYTPQTLKLTLHTLSKWCSTVKQDLKKTFSYPQPSSTNVYFHNFCLHFFYILTISPTLLTGTISTV